MDQPEGFVEPDKKELVCRLKRLLYSLKQPPRHLYVDDMLIAAQRKKDILQFKKMLGKEFEMKDLGATKKILDIYVMVEAVNSDDRDKWLIAVVEEMKSLRKNKTWELVTLPKGSKPVIYDMALEQMDVKTSFFHGYLEETIYMDQPEGFVEPDKKELVCRLKRLLYSLKQPPRQ
ncbi:Retrovirus-related Pol polyprotein from transposon TNT 1-94-like protein [Drosera capensis]